MRMIGHLQGEANARSFGDFLLVEGIENQVEAEKDGSWAVWIHAEEELERAKGLLAAFLEKPADPKFKGTARLAESIKEQKRKEQEAYEKRVKARGQLFRPMSAYGFGPVTFALICICVLVFLLQQSGSEEAKGYVAKLYISGLPGQIDLPEVRHGEIWRLFTPMLLHMSPLHILFNMLWLKDLGSMIEGRQSSRLLICMVLALAGFSDLVQYFAVGPAFGGMSGVVYGLFGYVWIRGKLDPGSGLFVHPSTVTMMIIWFVVCLTGLVGHVANGAHAGGLVMGAVWGWLSSLKRR